MIKIKNLLQQSVIAFVLLLTALNASLTMASSLNIHYLSQPHQSRPLLSSQQLRPVNLGLAGALLAIEDANTTGKFIDQHFSLLSHQVSQSTALIEYIKHHYQLGDRLFVLDVDTPSLLAIKAWARDKSLVLFNISNPDDALRNKDCFRSLLHTSASNAMKADALAQWLLNRRFNKVLVIQGKYVDDLALVNSFQRAAKRFGIKIIEQKTWQFDSDLRRSVSREMPLFTQTSRDYDVVFVADQLQDFANYLPYNTYLPRPVIGSAGLQAMTWHWSIEQWGAVQLQNRFRKLAKRAMQEVDFNGYLAISSIAQASQKTAIEPIDNLLNYLTSDRLELAAYMGRKLSFRPWNGQLRMPIALVHSNGLISQSPQPGVLHPTNELDTLGFEQAKSQCDFTRKE